MSIPKKHSPRAEKILMDHTEMRPSYTLDGVSIVSNENNKLISRWLLPESVEIFVAETLLLLIQEG